MHVIVAANQRVKPTFPAAVAWVNAATLFRYAHTQKRRSVDAKGRLILIAVLGGAMVLGWLFAGFGKTARVGSALSVLMLGGGAFGIFAGLLLKLQRVRPGGVWGFSAVGTLLTGVGLSLWGIDGLFQIEPYHAYHVRDVVGGAAFVAGAIVEGRVRPAREPDFTKLHL